MDSGQTSACQVIDGTVGQSEIGHVGRVTTAQYNFNADCTDNGYTALAEGQVWAPDGTEVPATVIAPMYINYRLIGVVTFIPAVAGVYRVRAKITGTTLSREGTVLVVSDIYPDAGIAYGQPSPRCEVVELTATGRAICLAGTQLSVIDEGGASAYPVNEPVAEVAVAGTSVWIEVVTSPGGHPVVVLRRDLGSGPLQDGAVGQFADPTTYPGIPFATQDRVYFANNSPGLIEFEVDPLDAGALAEQDLVVDPSVNGLLGWPAWSPVLGDVLLGSCQMHLDPIAAATCNGIYPFVDGTFAADESALWGRHGSIGFGLSAVGFGQVQSTTIVPGDFFNHVQPHFPSSPFLKSNNVSDRLVGRLTDAGVTVDEYHWLDTVFEGANTRYVWGFDDGGTLWVVPR